MSEIAEDSERDAVVAEELACLERVQTHLRERSQRVSDRPAGASSADYEMRLLDLRDQISSARMEDVPPLVQEMERLQSLMVHRRDTTAVTVDARSPYFGRLVIEEGPKQREVLIGRGTYLDTKSGVRIVDWRDAPVSRLYYRYEEGQDYDEVFGDREVTGLVKTRRSLSIIETELRRITSPQGTFVRGKQGFRRVEGQSFKLTGGSGTAIRAEQHHRPGKLGIGSDGGEDKHLREITALIDPRQFELITRSDAGLVVIQGGAGSGKTTIGLHRLAYLAFQDSRRFRPDKMLVIVFNDALARYVARVLPALGIEGVAIRTYEDWVRRIRQSLYTRLPSKYREDTPSVVSRFKKHPLLLRLIDQYVARVAEQVTARVESLTANAGEQGESLRKSWSKSESRPFAHRLHGMITLVEGEAARSLPTDVRVGIERTCRALLKSSRDIPATWAELLSDRTALGAGVDQLAPGTFTAGELDRVVAWCSARSAEIVGEIETKREEKAELRARDDDDGAKGRRGKDDDDEKGREEEDDDEEMRRGIDGFDIAEDAKLDPEDDTIFLRLHQRLRGPLTRGKFSKDPIVYEHILVDEAQDLSPVELAVVLDTTSPARSITLSGDVQQRLMMDNGFTDWKTVLGELALSHVEVEPLKLSYRSTKPIIDFSRAVLGPLASADAPLATREGAPVDLFTHGHTGDAVATLSEALRDLMQSEPQASVAVITRFPEQADLYYGGLQRAEVPYLRRVADQDFSFKAGVDVTDVRQVKGLEFDYVVIVEASESSYPDDDEARHLLHIAATRAAHQLWLFAVGRVSPLIPQDLKDRSL
jgi:DNA helicase-2/ATP-dependent DNA helicase PcrA